MKVTLISVGTLSQKAYADAFSEYAKRFSAHGILECAEIREKKIDASPSEAQIAAALDFEGDAILSKIPPRAFVFAMAIEGKSMTSEAFASLLDRKMTEGVPEFCFVIGSSFGLSDKVKRRADALLFDVAHDVPASACESYACGTAVPRVADTLGRKIPQIAAAPQYGACSFADKFRRKEAFRGKARM